MPNRANDFTESITDYENQSVVSAEIGVNRLRHQDRAEEKHGALGYNLVFP
jgi:hypothetical protein